MKQALCIKSIEELNDLINNKIVSIETNLVDREICEKPENKLLQIIPYVVIYTLDFETGKLKFLHYLRAPKGGDDRLLSKTSVGFGGHIDDVNDIVYTTAVENTCTMSINDLIDTCLNTAQRELKEELSIELSTEDISKINPKNTVFFLGDQSIEVNQVHIGMLVPIKLNEESFNNFKSAAVFNVEEIAELGELVLNFSNIISSFDFGTAIRDVAKYLVHNSNIEDWSEKVISYTLDKEIKDFFNYIDYSDLVAIHKAKVLSIVEATPATTTPESTDTIQ